MPGQRDARDAGRRAGAVSLALCCLLTLASVRPAAAALTLDIAGFQYLAREGARAGPAGSLNTPAGFVPVGDPPRTRALGVIVNRDPVEHTWTPCVARCDTADPEWDQTGEVRLSALGGAASLEGWTGHLIFGCRFHPWMRGAVVVDP